ncbi:MAG TPA: sugar ABC transporter permease, partial [Candidatus Caccousia avistercoris]|nr:sugar ABC transporter permease [Candidatus Caccousia avistercoris]
MLPALLLIVIYEYIPMGGGLLIAFKDFRITRGILGSDWCGFRNFEMLFTSPFFSMVMKNTIVISLYKLVFGFPAPIILAIMLNEVRSSKVKRVFQTAYYLPHFISWVVIGNLLFAFFAPQSGMLSGVFQSLGITFNPLMDSNVFQGFLAATDIWKEIGWSSIIYLASITSIDSALYEAAAIDGAGKMQMIRHITFPALLPTIITMLLLRVGHILNAGFDQIFILQNSA